MNELECAKQHEGQVIVIFLAREDTLDASIPWIFRSLSLFKFIAASQRWR